MSARLILVGEAPGGTLSTARRPSLALTGRAGRTLCDLAGWDWIAYLRHARRLNLFADPMRGRWPRALAREVADYLEVELAGPTPVVLLGQKVAEAFGVADDPLYTWIYLGWANVAKVPHPSGLNRMWNDPAERTRAREFLGPLL